MFSKEDFEIEDVGDLMGFLLILPFVGLVAPFIIALTKFEPYSSVFVYSSLSFELII